MLKRARKDLKEAYRQREQLDTKIGKLRQTVITLGVMCEEEENIALEFLKVWGARSGKLTEMVGNALHGASAPLTAIDVRDLLEDLGYRFKTANPLASIHSVIKRLEEQDIVVRVRQEQGDGTYSHTSKFWPASRTLLRGWCRHSELKLVKQEGKMAWVREKASER